MANTRSRNVQTATDIQVPRWEHFHHGADIGIRGVGANLATAFEQAALALTGVICEPESVRPETTIPIDCTGDDDEFLLVNWIDTLVYEMAIRGMLFSRFRVNIEGQRLTADISGEPIDVARHQPAVEVKGATLTALHVGRDANGDWVAECVVDV